MDWLTLVKGAEVLCLYLLFSNRYVVRKSCEIVHFSKRKSGFYNNAYVFNQTFRGTGLTTCFTLQLLLNSNLQWDLSSVLRRITCAQKRPADDERDIRYLGNFYYGNNYILSN